MKLCQFALKYVQSLSKYSIHKFLVHLLEKGRDGLKWESREVGKESGEKMGMVCGSGNTGTHKK